MQRARGIQRDLGDVPSSLGVEWNSPLAERAGLSRRQRDFIGSLAALGLEEDALKECQLANI